MPPTRQIVYPNIDTGSGIAEALMNEDVLNITLRKFLKKVGVTSQREIEQAVRDGVAAGKLKGNEALSAKVVLTLGGVNKTFEIDGVIELE
jgi:hypothetical protein